MSDSMIAAYEVLTDLESTLTIQEAFARDVLIGLSSPRKRISSRYFYDSEGSRLFQQITELEEYYPTACEREVLECSRSEIAKLMGSGPFNLVELGPGDARKTKILFREFIQSKLNFRYVPIDISEEAMQDLMESLQKEYPRLEVHGLISEYMNAVNWLKKNDDRINFVLFLGSNIGNFNREESRIFLHSLWNALNHNDMVLIGFDLKKDIEVLLRAYNDSKGVTRKFNLNLLQRINKELGGNFDLSQFRHFGTYDVFSGAMESYLVSLREQDIFIREIGQTFHFDAWEPIHMEYSYKYLDTDIEMLARDTGFVLEKQFYDSRRWFTDCIWRVQKMDSR